MQRISIPNATQIIIHAKKRANEKKTKIYQIIDVAVAHQSHYSDTILIVHLLARQPFLRFLGLIPDCRCAWN